ncbi:hypothetical protein, partial [Salmonella enterica]|uniref:hypothetical protein n=1 Tax=Salmonella enterica TaxID=28901 RepID=UPI001F26D5AD
MEPFDGLAPPAIALTAPSAARQANTPATIPTEPHRAARGSRNTMRATGRHADARLAVDDRPALAPSTDARS